MTVVWLLVAAAVVLGAVTVVALWRHGSRYDRLTYDDESVIGGGMAATGRQLGEAFSQLTWGSGSLDSWRRRCEASAKASQARRDRERGR